MQVLIVVAAIDGTPEVEPVRPNLYHVILTARNNSTEAVWVELSDFLFMPKGLPNDHACIFGVPSAHHLLLFAVSGVAHAR